MKNIKIILWIFFLVAGCYNGVVAKYYQYTDKNGNISFTDNLSEVPRDQLEQTKTFETVTPDKSIEKRTSQPRTKSHNNLSPDLNTWDGQLIHVAQTLEQKQKKLEQIQSDLVNEKMRLQKVSLKKLNADEKIAHQNSIKALNEKIDQYENQCNQLKSEIDLFNN